MCFICDNSSKRSTSANQPTKASKLAWKVTKQADIFLEDTDYFKNKTKSNFLKVVDTTTLRPKVRYQRHCEFS